VHFRDVRKFKETKKQFDKVREDMELSLVRNAQAPRHRPHEVEEATGALTLTRKCFRHLALDYVLQVSHRAVEMQLLKHRGADAQQRPRGGVSGRRIGLDLAQGDLSGYGQGFTQMGPHMQTWGRTPGPWVGGEVGTVQRVKTIWGRRSENNIEWTLWQGTGHLAAWALSPLTCLLLLWQINVLQAKKKFEILDSVSTCVGRCF
jgi:hypothetical protein